jgi:hypothetical protein
MSHYARIANESFNRWTHLDTLSIWEDVILDTAIRITRQQCDQIFSGALPGQAVRGVSKHPITQSCAVPAHPILPVPPRTHALPANDAASRKLVRIKIHRPT